jgi:hypothetical protein
MGFLTKLKAFLSRRRLKCIDCAHERDGLCFDRLFDASGTPYTYTNIYRPEEPYFAFCDKARKPFRFCGVFAKEFYGREDFYRDLDIKEKYDSKKK